MQIGGFYGSKRDDVLKRKYDMLVEEGIKFVCVSASSGKIIRSVEGDNQIVLSKVKVSETCLHSF